MKVYHVVGMRNCAVVFDETPGKAVAQAVTRDLVGSWEDPNATEVPLPKGCKIICSS